MSRNGSNTVLRVWYISWRCNVHGWRSSGRWLAAVKLHSLRTRRVPTKPHCLVPSPTRLLPPKTVAHEQAPDWVHCELSECGLEQGEPRAFWWRGGAHSPLQKRERTGTSFLYWLDWKSKHSHWNFIERKATQPSLRVFSGKLSKWEVCKVVKSHTKPYNFVRLNNCKGPHTIRAANVGSTRDLISQKTRVSGRKWVRSTELDIVNGSFCNLCALALWLALHIFASECWRAPIRAKQLSTVAILLYRFLSCWCLETFFT